MKEVLEIEKRLNYLGINTDIIKAYGVFIIELDKTGYTKHELKEITNLMTDKMILAHYENLSDVLCLNTRISVNIL